MLGAQLPEAPAHLDSRGLRELVALLHQPGDRLLVVRAVAPAEDQCGRVVEVVDPVAVVLVDDEAVRDLDDLQPLGLLWVRARRLSRPGFDRRKGSRGCGAL